MVTNMTAPSNNTSEGEYEAPGLEDAPQEELLTPHQLVPKVLAVRSSGAYP